MILIEKTGPNYRFIHTQSFFAFPTQSLPQLTLTEPSDNPQTDPAPESPRELPPVQAEMPFAIVHGEKVFEVPKDLYIPPDALEILLETFEGPLDLLLYMIKRQNLDILDIPIAEITRQYTQYLDVMTDMRFELAGEYLLMAAMLAEIKSRMLLPKPAGDEEDVEDPRAELVRRLQEYERFKEAAENIDTLPRINREIFTGSARVDDQKVVRLEPDVSLRELVLAFAEVMHRASLFHSHQISAEKLTVRERMTQVLERLNDEGFTEFRQLFSADEGRHGVVVTFLAVLELIREQMLDLVQAEPYAPIHVRARGAAIIPPDVDDALEQESRLAGEA